jgi:hypothetical protein
MEQPQLLAAVLHNAHSHIPRLFHDAQLTYSSTARQYSHTVLSARPPPHAACDTAAARRQNCRQVTRPRAVPRAPAPPAQAPVRGRERAAGRAPGPRARRA